MNRNLKRVLKWGVVAFSIVAALAVSAFGVAWWRSDNDCAERAATVPENPMQAIVYCDYGGPDVLHLESIAKPALDADRVLVRVRAASVNPLDYHYMRGTPYVMRLDSGLRKPAATRIGRDFAGVVEAVGDDVTAFQPGDEVFGARTGAFAEYLSARPALLVRKPENITFEQAAAVPVAALTALQALRDKGKVQPGQKVLINGASGGVGTFAVQIAKSLGARVTGVCSTRNVELVRSLGADQVVDYTRQDLIRSGERYDVIIDMVGNHSLTAFRRILNADGIYVIVGGPKGRWLSPMDRVLKAKMLSAFVSQDFVMLLSSLSHEDLTMLRDLIQTGKITPIIDRRYSLREVPEAIRYLETGRARGKVIITISELSRARAPRASR